MPFAAPVISATFPSNSVLFIAAVSRTCSAASTTPSKSPHPLHGVAGVDDQMLGAVLRGRRPKNLASKEISTTGHWYVRLCQAAVGALKVHATPPLHR
jgi:hypothetical protein